MSTYKVSAIRADAAGVPATLLRLAFGEAAQNDRIVRDAVAALEALNLEGGRLILLNGPASLPVAVALAHGVGHIFAVVGVFDPKMAAYVVAVSHDPAWAVGATIPAASVKEAVPAS